MTNTIIKYLAATFFIIAIVVHIHGIIYHPTTESDASHITHIITYGVCLSSVLLRFKKAALLYALAAAYPLYYHAGCAIAGNGSVNGICMFVCLFVPFVGIWLIYTGRK